MVVREIPHQWLGRMAYEEAFALQERQVAAHRERGAGADVLLLLEHEPVYTIGRTPDQTSLREAARLPHPVVQINRGGQATYHGPGQLVGYPILDLTNYARDLHRYLRALEEILIVLCAQHGVAAGRREGLTGVWIGLRKIASIGVGVRQWVSMHGFAMNISGELAGFDEITPCGIAGVEMTSLERECGHAVTVREAAEEVAMIFNERFAGLMTAPAGTADSAGLGVVISEKTFGTSAPAL